jgi:hypothetical protein
MVYFSSAKQSDARLRAGLGEKLHRQIVAVGA